jgi:hypothetical protein
MATDAIMALGAQLMQRLRSEEEQACEDADDFELLVYALRPELGMDVVLKSKFNGPWRYFTVPSAPRAGLTLAAHSRELVLSLKTQMKAFNVTKIDKVALDVQCGTVDWPTDKRGTVRVSLWF